MFLHVAQLLITHAIHHPIWMIFIASGQAQTLSRLQTNYDKNVQVVHIMFMFVTLCVMCNRPLQCMVCGFNMNYKCLCNVLLESMIYVILQSSLLLGGIFLVSLFDVMCASPLEWFDFPSFYFPFVWFDFSC